MAPGAAGRPGPRPPPHGGSGEVLDQGGVLADEGEDVEVRQDDGVVDGHVEDALAHGRCPELREVEAHGVRTQLRKVRDGIGHDARALGLVQQRLACVGNAGRADGIVGG